MKRSLISLFSLLLLFLIEVRAENGKPYVVVISVDGLHPELYLKSDQLGLKIPTIKRLMQQGSYAEAMETVYPSVTYPSHTTLVTGVRPIAHGIVANLIFVDPKERNQDGSEDWFWHAKAIKTPTLWSEAKKAGLRTAAVGWPVTAGAEIDYLIPEIWRGPFSTTREVGLEYATPEIREKLDAVMPKSEYGLDDEARAAAAEMIIKDYKPNLMLLHFVALDYVEHISGPKAPIAYTVLQKTDQHIARIIEATKAAGTYDKTTFFIVSDHGFLASEKVFNPGVALAKAGFVTLSKEGKVVDWKATPYGGGGSTAILLKDKKDKEIEKAVVELFEALASRPDSPIYRVVKRDELAKMGANSDAICFLDAKEGYLIGYRFSGDMITKSTDERGTHGHLPSRPELYASLIVAGRGISPGRKEPFVRNVHIAPTVAALLGFAFPGKVEGLALREFLTVAIPQASKTVVAGTEPTVEKPTESRKNRKNKKAKENR